MSVEPNAIREYQVATCAITPEWMLGRKERLLFRRVDISAESSFRHPTSIPVFEKCSRSGSRAARSLLLHFDWVFDLIS